MKSHGNDGNNNNNNNWLGFSLSPNVNKMEGISSDHPQSLPSSNIASTSFSNPPPPPPCLNYPGIYYGMEVENGGYYSPLSVMPLKSDGTLCIMEAINRSQQPQGGMVTSSTPKLENFFGGTTMGTHHHYEANERGNVALSLDSIYYQDFLNNNNNNPLQGYSPLEFSKETHNLQLPTTTTIGDHDISTMKSSWVSRDYPTTVDHVLGENGVESAASLGTMGYGDLQSLSLSMSPGSQSSCITGSHQISPAVTTGIETKKRGPQKVDQHNKQIVHRKSIDTFGQRTSQYRGVTRHRWTGRYEAHLWDNSCKKEGQSRKGRQVYLGGYDMEEKAARAYDLAALKYWGPSTHINFPLENYQQELEDMKNMTRQEHVAHLRRKSSGFSRGASMYRGVTRHHQHGRWQARIGRVAGNKDLYLGTFSTQEEAAEAYDVAAIKFRGVNAVTNFDISRYDVERIMASNTLLSGELARRNKNPESRNVAAIISNETPSDPQSHEEPPNAAKGPNDNNTLNWNMALHQLSQPPPNEMIGIGTQQDPNGTAKIMTRFSNASSLVTNLSSCSREGSSPPDKNYPVHLAMPPTASKLFTTNQSQTLNSSWIPSTTTQLRSHLPVFAAWTTDST